MRLVILLGKKLSEDGNWVYEIKADRFLRGMIRLIVGACIYIGQDKMSLDDLRRSMDKQTPLPQPYAVPAQGLFLTDIHYPYLQVKSPLLI